MKCALLTVVVVAALNCGSGTPSGAPTAGRVTLEVSGGFTGWDRVLAVEPDGTTRIEAIRGPSPPTRTPRVDKTVLSHLHALVSDPAFAQLEAEYLPAQPGADLQDYTVTAEVGGHVLKTMARDGAALPPILRDVLTILTGLTASVYAGAQSPGTQ